MKMGWWRTTGTCAALAALTLAAAAPRASAQGGDEDCRCVDADGNAIENCSCFVIPDFEMPDVEAMMRLGSGDFDWTVNSARPRLGVTVSTDQDDARGARVTGVMEDGPAHEAGIREGDIITRVDGQSLLEPLEGDAEEDFDLDESVPVQRLLALARELEPGESVDVAYVRDGTERTATVEIRDLAGMWGAWARDFTRELRPRVERLRSRMGPLMERFERDGFDPIAAYPGVARYGLSLIELTPGLGEYFGADRGVLVTDVEEGSALGLQAGDVILGVGDRDVDSPGRVRRILATYDREESVTFRVLRRGSEVDVSGRLEG